MTKSNIQNPLAVIDIGSNSIRLVIYGSSIRAPIPIHNESYICAIGRDLEVTGKLHIKGVQKALSVLKRFKGILQSMKYDGLYVLGTAALRDAKDADDFVSRVFEETGFTVRVLSGKQEAERSAYGVICGIPDADGLVADLGGGSLELIDIRKGIIGHNSTFPIGTLRLAHSSRGNIKNAKQIINNYIKQSNWTNLAKGRPLYAVGGSWRALARVCISQMNYPLQVLDNFILSSNESKELFDFISTLSPQSLQSIKGVPKNRAEYLPISALILNCLLDTSKADRLIFSIYGMREGQFYKSLPKVLKKEDPLISASKEICRSINRDILSGEEVFDWLSPIINDKDNGFMKLRKSASILRDICWMEHTDYRPEQAFLRVLRLPFMGIQHQDRATLALTLFYRYGEEQTEVVKQSCIMLNQKRLRWARTIGYALRLSYALTAGNTGLISKTKIRINNQKLILTLPKNEPIFYSGFYEKRLNILAQNLGLISEVITR